MSIRWDLCGAILTTAVLIGCSSTRFVSSWKAPGAELRVRGSKVVAVAMIESDTARRVAEDKMARELTARGAVGVPMYEILPGAGGASGELARFALEDAGVDGVVVMRPVPMDREIVTRSSVYEGPRYGGYWNGYYEFGWSHPGEAGPRNVVWVETLVYSLEDNKLVWVGQSRTMNPGTVDQLATELAAAAGDQLEQLELIQ